MYEENSNRKISTMGKDMFFKRRQITQLANIVNFITD